MRPRQIEAVGLDPEFPKAPHNEMQRGLRLRSVERDVLRAAGSGLQQRGALGTDATVSKP